MKKLYLFPLLLVFITGCKYGSKYEANEACRKWVSKGIKYRFESTYSSSIYDGNSRRCSLEADTNQILGFERKGVKEKFYSKNLVEEELNKLKEKLVKHFKY